MKIRIKTFNGELPSHLTVGKVYDANHCVDDLYELVEFTNTDVVIRISGCAYLNGGSWEIVNDAEF